MNSVIRRYTAEVGSLLEAMKQLKIETLRSSTLPHVDDKLLEMLVEFPEYLEKTVEQIEKGGREIERVRRIVAVCQSKCFSLFTNHLDHRDSHNPRALCDASTPVSK
jgi:hypothetical protein